MPRPEPFDVPPATARLVRLVRQHGGRVIAAGTTVVRALESAALGAAGQIEPASGWTSHVVTPEAGLHVVGGSADPAALTSAAGPSSGRAELRTCR